MTGLEPAASTLARWRSDLLSYIRSVRQPRLLGRVGLALVCQFCLSVRGARCFCQPHAVVISVTRLLLLLYVLWRLRLLVSVCRFCGADEEVEACSIVSVVVVSLQACEGELGGASVDHDEDVVVCFIVAFVVLCCFDAGVHDAGRAVALLEYFSDIRRSVSAATSPASDEF